MPAVENSFGSNFPTLKFSTLAMSPSFGAPSSWKRRRMANASRVPAAQRRSLFGNTAVGAIRAGTPVLQNEHACLENPEKRRTKDDAEHCSLWGSLLQSNE